MPNPFFFSGTITNSENFVGRENELRKIFSFLNTEYTEQIQHTSVIGARRIGKSSLLYHILQVNDNYLPTHENYRFVFLDLQDPRCQKLTSLLSHILEELEIYTTETLTLETFSKALEEERQGSGVWPVLLMDEFEELTERTDIFTDDFYDVLRSLGNNNLLGIVTASQHELKELATQEKLTSPFFNIFHQIELGEFSDDEVDVLLNRGRASDQSFSDDECKEIVKIAGKHPARLQLVASLVYETKASGERLQWNTIDIIGNSKIAA